MNRTELSKLRLILTGLTAMVFWSVLVWQQSTGGVPAHHLLHNADFPAISNWWGGLLLPLLSWLLLGRIHDRILTQTLDVTAGYPREIIVGFLCSTIYGLVLSQSFVYGYSEIASAMFFGVPLIGVFLRVYRAEYILGFILSMSFVFGAVLSTLFGSLIALISFVAYSIAHQISLRIRKAVSPK